MTTPTPTTAAVATALIAEDEPLLAAALRAELAHVWPELTVVATVADGHSAVTQALAHQPDVLFFDIQMPGQTGLDAAIELADAWPADAKRPFPALVFVTAFDQYACQAFEVQAVDYLLKPVQRERLRTTAQRLRTALQDQPAPAPDTPPGWAADHAPTPQQLAQLAALMVQMSAPKPVASAPATPPYLSLIQASTSNAQGATLVMVPVAQVQYFEAADKYVRVLTPDREVLIRTPLKELLAQLDPLQFWQIHRGCVVRSQAIELAHRDEGGKLWLTLRQRPERLAVSRLYAHLFKAM